MASKKIMDYIELCLSQGYKLDDIINRLRESGWPEKQIMDAARLFTEGDEVPQPVQKEIPKIPKESQQQRTHPQRPEHPQPVQKPPQEPVKTGPRPRPGATGRITGIYAGAGFVTSILGGAVMLFVSIVNLLVAVMDFSNNMFEGIFTLGGLFPMDGGLVASLLGAGYETVLSAAPIALSAAVIIGSVLITHPDKTRIGIIMVIACSAVNAVLFWGIGMLGVIGGIIGLAGGILGILKK